MKINKIILAVLLPIMLSSCEQWLDVAPDDQVNEETLFANGDGYRNALNGVYRDMATTQMYGRELTWGFVDVMGWVYDPLTIYYDCSNHEYYDVLLGKYNVQVVKNISEAFGLKPTILSQTVIISLPGLTGKIRLNLLVERKNGI